jgi:hypothetical protein
MAAHIDDVELQELYQYMTPEDRAWLDRQALAELPVWEPLPGPQQLADISEADIIGYGGAAGGGKTDLAIGKMLRKHKRRYRLPQERHRAHGVRRPARRGARHARRLQWQGRHMAHEREGQARADRAWLGAQRRRRKEVPRAPARFQVLRRGKRDPRAPGALPARLAAHDRPAAACQGLLCFNPPTSAEGRWVIKFFAPWLDPAHPCPRCPASCATSP